MLHHPSLEEPVTCCNHLKGERGALSARCDHAGSCSPRTVSLRDSDLMITRPTVQELAATPQISCSSTAPAPHHPLHPANHVNMNVRRGESDPLRSRQPPFIFPSSDHEPDFAVTGPWSPRSYACSFCGREFNSAQALGGHMNIHRRDRARLRSSTSLSSLPHPSDLPPAPQIHTPKSGLSTLYLPFDAACRDHPASIMSTTYQPPTIISAAPTYKLLPMRSAADPALLAAMAAPPHHDDNSAAPRFSAPVSDLVSFRFGSARSCSATSVSNIHQNVAHSLFPNIDPHGSSLLIRPMLENSSFKPAGEARNVCPGQASSRRTQFRQLDSCSGAKGAGAQQGIQLGQAKGSNKRARGDDLDAVMISSEDKSTVQSCDEEPCNSVTSTRNSNSLQTAAASTPRSCARPSHDVHNDMKELNCLDLELRLGQSSPAPAADNN